MAEGNLVLIDSTVWLEAFSPGGASSYRQAVDQLLSEGRAATCEVVIAEVLAGAAEAEQAAVASEIGALPRLAMDGVGEIAARMALRLRGHGLAIPTTDLLVAATADRHGVALLHRDQHLIRALPVLGVEAMRL
jgi:predicted nucleic acid-binding protein